MCRDNVFKQILKLLLFQINSLFHTWMCKSPLLLKCNRSVSIKFLSCFYGDNGEGRGRADRTLPVAGVWEHHVEESFCCRPASLSCGLFLPRQPKSAREHSAVHQHSEPPGIISKSQRPKQSGVDHFCCLGHADNTPDPTVEQSGGGVS